MLDATIMRGENKDEPTRSILNVVPTKNDDGASYRCTVWNRALRQEHSLEAGTKIYVNCKYIKIGTTAGFDGNFSMLMLKHTLVRGWIRIIGNEICHVLFF